MAKAKVPYTPDHKEVLDRILLDIPGVTAGKMFGFPAYFIGKKLFACVYGVGVGVKLATELAEELLTRHDVIPFQPYGKPRMKNWVQINRSHSEDYADDASVFRTSVDYVSQLTKKGK